MREITIKLLFEDYNNQFEQAVKEVRLEVLWDHPWLPGATFRRANKIEAWANGQQIDPPEAGESLRTYLKIQPPIYEGENEE